MSQEHYLAPFKLYHEVHMFYHAALQEAKRNWPPLRIPSDFSGRATIERLFLKVPPVPKKYLEKVQLGGGGWQLMASRISIEDEWIGRELIVEDISEGAAVLKVMVPSDHQEYSAYEDWPIPESRWWPAPQGACSGIRLFKPTGWVEAAVIKVRLYSDKVTMELLCQGESLFFKSMPKNDLNLWALRDEVLGFRMQDLAPNRALNQRQDLPSPTILPVVLGFFGQLFTLWFLIGVFSLHWDHHYGVDKVYFWKGLGLLVGSLVLPTISYRWLSDGRTPTALGLAWVFAIIPGLLLVALFFGAFVM